MERNEHLIRLRAVAERLGVTPQTLRVYVRQGKAPPSVKIGNRLMFFSQGIADWLADGVGQVTKDRINNVSS